MRKPPRFVVGLTGGIATGKSTALAELERLGAATVSLDQIAREQARPGREAYERIVRDFGSCILRPDGTIDRALLGRVVFSDASARKGLERATHPLILRELDRLVSKLRGLVVVDVPLLFEKGLAKHYDATILIACRPGTQLKRLTARDGIPPVEAKRRIAAQWPLAQKRLLADVTIDNDTTVAALRAAVSEYHAGLELLYGGTPNGN